MDELPNEDVKWARLLATHVGKRLGDLLPADDAQAAGEMAALLAWARFEPARGFKFRTFARHSVRGAVLDAYRRERRHQDFLGELEHIGRPNGGLAGWEPLEVRAQAREYLAACDPDDRDFLVHHAGRGESLTTVSAWKGRDPKWGTRKWRGAVARLRALTVPLDSTGSGNETGGA